MKIIVKRTGEPAPGVRRNLTQDEAERWIERRGEHAHQYEISK